MESPDERGRARSDSGDDEPGAGPGIGAER